MLSREYGEAATEVLDILDHTRIEDVKKIPSRFLEFLKLNSLSDYTPNLDHSKPINEMDIKEETKGILGAIYRNWWCSKEEKANYEKIIKEKELLYQEELRKKYNPDDIFKNRKQAQSIENVNQENLTKEVQMVEYKKASIFSRILAFLGFKKTIRKH